MELSAESMLRRAAHALRRVSSALQRAFWLLAFGMGLVPVASAQELRFWTTEEQPDRLAKQEKMAADFKAKTGISVQVLVLQSGLKS